MVKKETAKKVKVASKSKPTKVAINKLVIEGLAMIEEADEVQSKLFKVIALMVVSLIVTIALDIMFGFLVALTAHIIMIGSFIWAISLDRKLAYLNGHIEGLHKGTKVMLNK